MSIVLIQGNAKRIALADESVHCCVCSPPYWGLRDYGIGGQLGLESTPEQYVANMVAVFREVKRVLRPDGTCWVNLGSSYASSNMQPSQPHHSQNVVACGIDDKERLSYPAFDYAYRHLCDEHLGDFLTHHRRTPNIDQHQERSDVHHLQISHDSGRLDCAQASLDALPLCVQVSTSLLSFLQLRGECSRCDSRASALSELGSCDDGVSQFSRNQGELVETSYDNQDIAYDHALQMRHTQYKGTVCEYCKFSLAEPPIVQPDYNIYSFKQKDMIPTPWMVAMALQKDGWYLRSDIIWDKVNPMPESVTDRPTKSHEYLFLLTKSAKYFYDCDAVREPHKSGDWSATAASMHILNAERRTKQDEAGIVIPRQGGRDSQFINPPNPSGRNRRTVWHIATAPYSGAHFATYPPALVEPCIKAGTSERGVCPECGAPWERVTESEVTPTQVTNNGNYDPSTGWSKTGWVRGRKDVTILGWRPTCECKRVCPSCAGGSVDWTVNSPCCKNEGYVSHDPIPATVFDPFAGSGTTLQVARALGRNGVGLDLSLEYLHLARQRLSLDALEAWGKAKKDGSLVTDLPMFSTPVEELGGGEDGRF